MVVGAFPAAKLGALLLKQISKPIANVVKNQAKSSPVFRKYVCMPPAQFYNWCEVKAKMWILNLGKPVNIPVLNEAMAIELGANLLGEGIIFIIAAAILISEYSRSARKEAAKEEAKQKEMTDLQNTIRELFIQSEEQGTQLRELMRKVGDLETKLGYKPSKPQSPVVSPPRKPSSIPSVSSKEYLVQQSKESQNEYLVQQSKELPRNIILKAINDVEDQFWNYPLIEREDGILTLSLYYLHRLLKLGQS